MNGLYVYMYMFIFLFKLASARGYFKTLKDLEDTAKNINQDITNQECKSPEFIMRRVLSYFILV